LKLKGELNVELNLEKCSQKKSFRSNV